MTALITDLELKEDLIAKRRAAGGDKYDEVWEGVYVMAPMANDEHQYLVKELTIILGIAIDWAGLGETRPGVNVSDRPDDWTSNYRVPDVAVFLNDTQAENRDTFWYGGPDFGIEIVTPNDQSLDKLPFYASVGTRELMLVDRDPWQLSLYRLVENEMVGVATSNPADSNQLASEVLPLTFRLTSHGDQLTIGITHHDGQQSWSIEVDYTS